MFHLKFKCRCPIIFVLSTYHVSTCILCIMDGHFKVWEDGSQTFLNLEIKNHFKFQLIVRRNIVSLPLLPNKMCHTKVILANEIQSIIIMFHTYIQDILWKKFPDWCLPDKQHPILRFPLVEGRDVLLQLQLYRQNLPSPGGKLRIGLRLSGRHQSWKFFHRISCIYVWNIILGFKISFASMAHLSI